MSKETDKKPKITPLKDKNTPSFKEGRSALDAYEGTKKQSTDAVLIRNFAVYVLYRKVIFISVLSAFLSLFSAFLVYEFITQKTSPQYVQLDDQGRLLNERPLSDKDRQDGEVTAFAIDAVKKLNTYDYINIKAQINSSKTFFTPSGWKGFLSEYTDSNTPIMVQDKRMIVSSEIIGEPKVTKQGVISGVEMPSGPTAVYTWAINIPFRITYTAHSGKTDPTVSGGDSGYAGSLKEEGVLELLVMRTPANILPRGIGIASYNFDVKK